jgi:hypothetical protein
MEPLVLAERQEAVGIYRLLTLKYRLHNTMTPVSEEPIQ